jgi:hypothetical protein
MIRAIFKHNYLLLFAIAFSIPLIVMGFLLSTNLNYASIVANGIETTGYIIPNSYDSNLYVNDVPYYHIGYVFYDEYGVEHYGKTSDAFSYYDVMILEEYGLINIKYNPETFEAVQASYSFFDDGTTVALMMMLAIFGLFDLVFWIISIRTILYNLSLIKVGKSGKEYSAMVTHISTNIRINGVDKYKVYYTWTDDTGRACHGASRSQYGFNQAKKLEDAKKIKIMAMGNKSYIVTNPDTLSINYQNAPIDQVEDNYARETVAVAANEWCDYCGEKISSSDKHCPNCGAKIQR